MKLTLDSVDSALEAECVSEATRRAVLDRLRPRPSELPHTGAGLFVRRTDLYPDYADDYLSWASICVLAGGRKLSRDPEFWAERKRAGLGLSAWDWFPRPENPTKGLEEAVTFAAENGAVSFILNVEKDFRGQPGPARAYAETARELCDEHDLALGFCSYSQPHTVRDLPWGVFAELCDFGVPQIYDRENKFDPDYPRECFESYREAGFEKVLPACGIYWGIRGTPWRWRWRKPEMVRRHLDLFPESDAWIAWPLGGSKPPVSALVELEA